MVRVLQVMKDGSLVDDGLSDGSRKAVLVSEELRLYMYSRENYEDEHRSSEAR